MTDENRPQEGRRLFGRRRGHKLRPKRAELMDVAAPELAIPGLAKGRSAAPASSSIDVASLFDNPSDLWLEIGFGGGEHLAGLARENPDIGMIGCEHFIDGVAKLVAVVVNESLKNVRVHAHDARDLMDALPDNSVGRIYLLYPDPWPKKRHRDRRFFNRETLDSAARLLKPGGEYRVASDIPDYISHCLRVYFERRADGAQDVEWTAERADDWRNPWPHWRSTRYELKALAAGRRPLYLRFRKV
ncbi:MAG: tRNA (guanine(46)-N(7))-methyltransferase TrmB [Neomegalonema sp.]|nr:tRNA (guanine(46)-N(7))-methyltransferase TrmB [Neomegalonema sp.]